MAILRSKEISEMGFEELDSHLSELRKDLMKINGILASGGIPEDVGKAREIKRTIARILTHKQILSQKPKKPAEELENPKVISRGDEKPEKEVVKEKVPELKEKPKKAAKTKDDITKKVSKDKIKNVSKKKR